MVDRTFPKISESLCGGKFSRFEDIGQIANRKFHWESIGRTYVTV